MAWRSVPRVDRIRATASGAVATYSPGRRERERERAASVRLGGERVKVSDARMDRKGAESERRLPKRRIHPRELQVRQEGEET